MNPPFQLSFGQRVGLNQYCSAAFAHSMQTPALTGRIDKVVTDLGDAKDDVLALTEELCQDLWQQITRTDPDSIRTGSERMIAAVTAVTTFQKACDELTTRLRGFLPPPPPQPPQPALPLQTGAQMGAFTGKEKITLRDSWTYRRPFGFILRGKAYTWKRTWIDVLYEVARALREADAQLFETLPERSEFVSTHGNTYVARDRSLLRVPLKLTDTVFVESNLNANLIRDNIRRLLRVFGVQESEIEFYLRQ